MTTAMHDIDYTPSPPDFMTPVRAYNPHTTGCLMGTRCWRPQERECQERQVRCRSCGDSLPARQLEEHASSLCRKKSWTCACGQGSLPLVERRDHLKNCEAFVDAWEASIEKVCTMDYIVVPWTATLGVAEGVSGGRAVA